jgi:colanic acid biosynthesis glycosyl transferase WcaI
LRILLLNQCFYPDVVSTAQHLSDLAKGLSERKHEVTVVTSDRGYDNPDKRFPPRESWNDVEVIRIPSLSLGKETKLKRALNFGSFLTVCSVRVLTMRRFDVVVALTSPPLISFLAAMFVAFKGGRFCFWVMDLNPDEAIAAGWLNEDSFVARILKRLLNHSLKRADRTIVLDRFMKERVLRKGVEPGRVSVLPPWSHDDAVSYSQEGRRSFRSEHGLDEKFVIMYSGNHSPCHPLDTILEAALILAPRDQFVFCFVGGGSEKRKVREFAQGHQLANVISLPYQPLDQLSASLSAADLHVVVMGDNFTGIVHPCKIYNIVRIGIPTLYIGPPESHITDIAAKFGSEQLCFAQHGDTSSVVQLIIDAANNKPLSAGTHSDAKKECFSKNVLLPQMIDLVEFSQSTVTHPPDIGSVTAQRTYTPDKNSNAQEVVSL